MKKKFKAGEWCKFSNEEIPHILDVLSANGYDINFSYSSNTNDCILVDSSGRLTPFNSNLMTDKFWDYSETDRHGFMVIALRLEEGMGIRWQESSIEQRKHVTETMESIGIKQTFSKRERGETRYGGSFLYSSGKWNMTATPFKNHIPYIEWCKRLCIEPIHVKSEPEINTCEHCGAQVGNNELGETCYKAPAFIQPTPHSFCETPKEECYAGYCEENGCMNRKRSLVNNNEPTAEPVFDPEKPIQVSDDDGFTWYPVDPNIHLYLGVGMDGKHVFQEKQKQEGVFTYHDFNYIRNIQEFNASMLEVGEFMETEEGRDGKRNLIKRISKGMWIDVRNGSDVFHDDIAQMCKGRRVDVEIKVKEV